MSEPTQFHYLLGVLGYVSLLALIVIDSLPQYDVSNELAAMLAISYLIFLGFGAIFTSYFEAKYD